MILAVVLRVSSRLVSIMILDPASIVILVMIFSMINPGVTLIACSSSSWIWIAILSLNLIRRLALVLILSWS